MRIAVVADCYPVEEGTGIVRYVTELVHRLDQGPQIHLIRSSPVGTLESLVDHCLVTPLKALWQQRSFDVLHAVDPINALSFPWARKPTVVTYHDLATIGYPRGTKRHVVMTAPYFYRVGKYCSKVIANSSQTKDELIQRLKFPDEKISVINLGVADTFIPRKMPARDGFIVGYLGAIAPRRRIDYLLRAFCYLKKTKPRMPIRLVIHGRSGPERAELARLAEHLHVQSDVEFRDPVPENALVDVYNSFDVFVLPSEWEGFGLPILEAQRCGIPVVTREDARIPTEVSKCSVKAVSERDMADKIYALCLDDDFRKKTIASALGYSSRFTWDRTVQETLSVYEEAFSEQ